MEIKEGMYVRYKKIGDGEKIAKIKEILPPNDRYDTAFYKFNDFDGTIEAFIVKASSNIIDLIEEGDYVNGKKVLLNDEGCQEFRVDGFNWGNNVVKYENIKSVVTKEQFKNMEYEVKENE